MRSRFSLPAVLHFTVLSSCLANGGQSGTLDDDVIGVTKPTAKPAAPSPLPDDPSAAPPVEPSASGPSPARASGTPLETSFDQGPANARPFEPLPRPSEPVPTGPFTCVTTAGVDSLGPTRVVALTNENNYSLRTDLTLANTKVKPSSNLFFSWGAVDQDVYGQALDPKQDIQSVIIAVFPWGLDELQSLLVTDQVGDNDAQSVTTLFTREPNQNFEEPQTAEGFTSHDFFTDVNFNHVHVEQSMLGANLTPDAWDPKTSTWAVLLQNTSDIPAPSGGVKLLHTFTLDPEETNTEVTFDNNSSQFRYSTLLQQWHPVFIPTELASVAVRWSSLSKSGAGVDVNNLGVRRLFINHYSETPEQLEQHFTDLVNDELALEQYTNDTSAVFNEGSARLRDFTTKDGKRFSGVTPDGTWLIGINCDTCKTPAPTYLGVLRPCTGG